jgi:protein-tyrosine phosphatase
MDQRILSWEGCNNVRDLGGLKTMDGKATRLGAIIRGDSPSRLTPAGWEALYEYGVRTIITLRTHGMEEPELDFESPYRDIQVIQAPIEDITDEEFLERYALTDLWGTPMYFEDAYNRWPGRHAAVITTIARAHPGGVLFHCIRGHDRTGIITLLLLSLAGVTREEILTDYELSVDPERDELLTKFDTSVREVIFDTLESLDAENYLLHAGVTPEDIAIVRSKLLGRTNIVDATEKEPNGKIIFRSDG